MVNKIRSGKMGEKAGLAGHILGLDYDKIAENVVGGVISDSDLSDVTAICRRRFRKNEVLVLVEIEDDYESGIAFTAKGICSWTDTGSDIDEIAYTDITHVDFDDEYIMISGKGEEISIYLGDDAEEEKYPRYMYNFIMDILEYFEGHEGVPGITAETDDKFTDGDDEFSEDDDEFTDDDDDFSGDDGFDDDEDDDTDECDVIDSSSDHYDYTESTMNFLGNIARVLREV